MGGVDQVGEIFTATTGLDEDVDETLRQVNLLDGRALETGIYSSRVVQTSHYPVSAVSSASGGRILINNQRGSPFGAGWTLDGLNRLHRQDDGSALITEGDGSPKVFRPAMGGTGDFAGGLAVPVVRSPEAIAAGDFNEDAIVDFVTAHSGQVPLTLALGDGERFATVPILAPPTGVSDVEAADLNGDGHLDLAMASLAVGGAIVRFGDGRGAFSEPARVPAPGVRRMAVGDLNEDGALDLAMTAEAADAVRVLFGDGVGSFSAPMSLTVGRRPQALLIHDFKGDGNSDLAVANTKYNDVSLLFGDGLGGFVASVDIAVGSSPLGLAAGDLDGDEDVARQRHNPFWQRHRWLLAAVCGGGGNGARLPSRTRRRRRRHCRLGRR